MIRATTTEQHAAAQRLLRGRVADPVPEVRNLQAVAGLVNIDILEFRGKVFIVPILDYRMGAAMLKLAMEARKLPTLLDMEARLDAEVRICEEAAELMNRACFPVGWKGVLRRLLGGWVRKWMRNPFRACSIFEVQQLLLFFSTCRTRSTVSISPGQQTAMLLRT